MENYISKKTVSIIITLSALVVVMWGLYHSVRHDAYPYRLVETLAPEASYPEGPAVIGNSLFYVEYGSHRIIRHHKGTSTIFWQEKGCGPSSLIPAGRKNILVSCYDANRLVVVNSDGQVTEEFMTDSSGNSFNGPNDFEKDDKGGYYFSASGPFDEKAGAVGSLYYMDRNKKIIKVASDLHYPNGLALTDEGKTLLVNEHLSRRITAYSVMTDGKLSQRRIFRYIKDIIPGLNIIDPYTGPDGLKADPEGRLYICIFGASVILVTDNMGSLLHTIKVPIPYVTNINFDNNQRHLYVTAVEDPWKYPYPGTVYRYSLNKFFPVLFKQ